MFLWLIVAAGTQLDHYIGPWFIHHSLRLIVARVPPTPVAAAYITSHHTIIIIIIISGAEHAAAKTAVAVWCDAERYHRYNYI